MNRKVVTNQWINHIFTNRRYNKIKKIIENIDTLNRGEKIIVIEREEMLLFPSILPIARQIASTTIGLDLIPVIPMTTSPSSLFYIDYTYGKDRKNKILKIKNKKISRINKN